MVDGQFRRNDRVHPGRVPTQPTDGLSHRRQIHQDRDAVGVVQEDPRRRERHRVPGPRSGRQPLDRLRRHRLSVLMTQQVFQEQLQRERQPRAVGDGVECPDVVAHIAQGRRRCAPKLSVEDMSVPSLLVIGCSLQDALCWLSTVQPCR